MKIKHAKSKTGKPEQMLSNARSDNYILHLYIAGQTSKAVNALNNIKSICEERLKGKYHIEVFDLLKNPKLGRDNQILAIPTLKRKLPLPVRLIIGDLSNTERVLVWLNLKGHS